MDAVKKKNSTPVLVLNPTPVLPRAVRWVEPSPNRVSAGTTCMQLHLSPGVPRCTRCTCSSGGGAGGERAAQGGEEEEHADPPAAVRREAPPAEHPAAGAARHHPRPRAQHPHHRDHLHMTHQAQIGNVKIYLSFVHLSSSLPYRDTSLCHSSPSPAPSPQAPPPPPPSPPPPPPRPSSCADPAAG